MSFCHPISCVSSVRTRLKEMAPEFELRGIRLSHIHAVSEPLHLGRLQGNHFDLVVRDLRPHGGRCHGDLEKLVNEAVENAKVSITSVGAEVGGVIM